MAASTTPRTGRREARKQQTRDRILDTAVRLLAEQGYDETSVDEIAEAADVARQTFFNYFRAKEDIVHAWVDRRRREVRAGLDRAADDDSIDRLRRGLLAVATLYDSDADTSRPMVRHWVRRGGPVLPHADDTAELFRDVLHTGQAEGRVRTDLDADVAAHVLLDVYLGRLYRWAADGGVLRRELEPAIAVVLDALRPDR